VGIDLSANSKWKCIFPTVDCFPFVDVVEFGRVWDRTNPIPRNTTNKCFEHNAKIGPLTDLHTGWHSSYFFSMKRSSFTITEFVMYWRYCGFHLFLIKFFWKPVLILYPLCSEYKSSFPPTRRSKETSVIDVAESTFKWWGTGMCNELHWHTCWKCIFINIERVSWIYCSYGKGKHPTPSQSQFIIISY